MAVTQEFYKTDPTTSTTLNGAINNSTTSITVTSGAVFPATGLFRIRIDDEIIKVTAVAANVLTVVRGTEGSAAASHLTLAPVTLVVTKVSLERLGTQIFGKPGDTHANRVSATEDNEGQLNIPSDGYSWARNENSIWVPYGPIFPLTTPVDPGTWVNQGSATITTTKDALVLSEPGQANTTSLRLRVKTAPATPYTLTAMLVVTTPDFKGQNGGGLCWRSSAAGEIVVFGLNQGQLRVFKYATATSVNAAYASFGQFSLPPWLRIVDNGTDRECYWSMDGKNFQLVHTVGRTDFATMNQIGIFVTAQNTATPNRDVATTVYSLKET